MNNSTPFGRWALVHQELPELQTELIDLFKLPAKKKRRVRELSKRQSKVKTENDGKGERGVGEGKQGVGKVSL